MIKRVVAVDRRKDMKNIFAQIFDVWANCKDDKLLSNRYSIIFSPHNIVVNWSLLWRSKNWFLFCSLTCEHFLSMFLWFWTKKSSEKFHNNCKFSAVIHHKIVIYPHACLGQQLIDWKGAREILKLIINAWWK